MTKAAVVRVSVGVVITLVLCGCATVEKAPSDEEVIARLAEEVVEAAEAQDIERLMTYFSESFSHYEFGDKEGLENFITNAKNMGYLDGIEVNMDEVKILVTGDTANVSGVYLSAAFGGAAIEITAAREEGVWKIIEIDVGI